MNDRALLQRLIAAPCSGAQLAAELGLTRAAVWKRIEALRAAGVEIHARPGRGYALAASLELLDAGRIRAMLSAPVRARLGTLEVAWDIDSTHAELQRRGAGLVDHAVLLAERQSGGRGRRGRRWASPLAAHVYLSLHRRFDGGVAALAGLSLAVGVATAEALHALGFTRVGLKWPNDLMVGDAKLGGILIDCGGEIAGPVRALIGIGINVQMPVSAAVDIEQPWCDLSQCAGAAAVSRNAVVAAVLERLLPALDTFARHGLAPFASRWQALDVLAGQPVRVIATDGERTGIALGIAADGALRVRGDDGVERRHHSGEVSLRRARAAG